MTKGDLEKLTKFVRVVMKHKNDPKNLSEQNKAIREQAKGHRNDKFIWKDGDLTLVEPSKASFKADEN